METFSDRLASVIQESGLGRPVFAANAGVGTSALAKWLSGKLTPKSDQLLAIARTAGVTMEWLLTGDDPKYPVYALWNRGFHVGYLSSGNAGRAIFEFLPPGHPDAFTKEEQALFHEKYVVANDEEKRKMLSLGPGTERFFSERCLNVFGVVMEQQLKHP